jgi:hypothetical protein
MIHRRLVIMQQKPKPTNDLFDGCNLSAPLLRLVLVPVGECLDLLLHSEAHVDVAVLLHTRQKQQLHQHQSCTHQANLRHTAVALQTLRNHTTASISQLVVPLHHTPLHAPPPPSLPQPHVTPSTAAPLPHSTPPAPLSHTPLLTKLILSRRLNRPTLAHSGRMSSSVSCCSVRCELHVRGGMRGCGQQARDATHVTQHHEARENAPLSE